MKEIHEVKEEKLFNFFFCKKWENKMVGFLYSRNLLTFSGSVASIQHVSMLSGLYQTL